MRKPIVIFLLVLSSITLSASQVANFTFTTNGLVFSVSVSTDDTQTNNTPPPPPPPPSNSEVWVDQFQRTQLGSSWIPEGNISTIISSNQLVISNAGSALWGALIRYAPFTVFSESWQIDMDYSLPQPSYGIAVGLRDLTGSSPSPIFRLFTEHSPSELQRDYWLTANSVAAIPPLSAATLISSPGQALHLTLKRQFNQITACATNKSNGSTASLSSMLNVTGTTATYSPGRSQVALWAIGTSPTYIQSISFTEIAPLTTIAAVGDSITSGIGVTDFTNRWASRLTTNVSVYAQPGCRIADAIAAEPEIALNPPSKLLLMMGGNDTQDNAFRTNYLSFCTWAASLGIQVIHLLPTPRTSIDETNFKNWIMATVPSTNIIDTFTPLVAGDGHSLNPVYDCGDGTHPNNEGNAVLAGIINNSGKL